MVKKFLMRLYELDWMYMKWHNGGMLLFDWKMVPHCKFAIKVARIFYRIHVQQDCQNKLILLFFPDVRM